MSNYRKILFARSRTHCRL